MVYIACIIAEASSATDLKTHPPPLARRALMVSRMLLSSLDEVIEPAAFDAGAWNLDYCATQAPLSIDYILQIYLEF